MWKNQRRVNLVKLFQYLKNWKELDKLINMSVNIWHKAEQKPKGDSWEIYYINAYNNVHRYSAEEMHYDECDWSMAVKCCAMLRWAYKESFIESTFNYSRITK